MGLKSTIMLLCNVEQGNISSTFILQFLQCRVKSEQSIEATIKQPTSGVLCMSNTRPCHSRSAKLVLDPNNYAATFSESVVLNSIQSFTEGAATTLLQVPHPFTPCCCPSQRTI